MFNELIEAGRSLLRAQPMNKDDYFEWSDAARIKIAERYGSNSPKTAEFLKARWKISTSHDTDPSYYLTQIGANLRRELRTLEKFLRQEDETPETRPPLQPPPADKPAAKKKVLIFKGLDPDHFEHAAKIVTELGLSPTEVSDQERQAIGPLRSALNTSGVTCALHFVDRCPTSRGAKARPKVESVLELGILLGALGPERVIALVHPKISMPARADGARQISLEDAGSLEANLKKTLQAFAATG